MKKFNQYNTLTLNGHTLHGGEIVNFCRDHAKPYMQALGEFVAEWLSPSPFITIKTSGSTGKPKTMNVLKENMLLSASLTAGYFGFAKGQTALLGLPVEYIAGKMMVVRAFYSGLNLICVEPSNQPLNNLPGNLFIDFAPLIPMQLQNADALDQVKNILLGGAPVNAALERKAARLAPAIYHGFGMTETLSHIALRRINGAKATKTYTALPGISLNTDARDCLIISAPFLENKVVTNDVVELQNGNSFIWKGRYDFVVNSGGVKLYPEELEEKLAGVVDCRFFLYGIEDDLLGQKLCLFLESQPFDMSGLKLILNEKLGRFERPREIFFASAFVETDSGKVNRKATVDRCLKR